MSQVKELLVEELQDLLHAEGQLLNALPKMAKAAHRSKTARGLREAPGADANAGGTAE